MKAARLTIAVALLASAATWAHAMTPAELQRLLQSGPRGAVAFEEVRESPWLSAPATSRGTLRSTPQALEKRVESPRQETWRLLADRLEWVGPGGARKELLFSQAPALQVLADVTRRAVACDFAALERDFHIAIQGDARAWSAQLRPRASAAARQLESVDLQGAGAQLQVVIVTDRRGERTTTRLAH